MKYQVLKPIAWSGRREPGEILELSETDAKNIGSEYLKPIDPETPVTEKKEPSFAPEGAYVEDDEEPATPKKKKAKK